MKFNYITSRSLSVASTALFLLLDAGAGVAATPQRSTNTSTHKSIKQLIKSLEQTDVNERITALNALRQLGPQAAPAVPAIITALNENLNFSTTATIAGRISPRLTDAALDTLAKIGPAAKPAGPYLVPLLTDRNELFRRQQVLDTLYSIGLNNSASKIIMQMVEQEGKLTQTRVSAIRLLGKIDPPATDALPLLQTLARDTSDARSAQQALLALRSINRLNAQIKPEQEESEKNRSDKAAFVEQIATTAPPETRLEALRQIGELGAKASYMVPVLMPLLQDKDPHVKQSTIDALAAMGDNAAAALPALVSQLCLQKTDPTRHTYSTAISAIDPSGKKSIPLLQSAFNDPFKARSAINLLEELGTMDSLTLAQQLKVRWRLR